MEIIPPLVSFFLLARFSDCVTLFGLRSTRYVLAIDQMYNILDHFTNFPCPPELR